MAVAQDMLRAGHARTAGPKPPPYGKGNVKKVRDVCGHVPDPDALIPGGSEHDLTPKGATRTDGCTYVKGEYDDAPRPSWLSCTYDLSTPANRERTSLRPVVRVSCD